MSFSDDPKIRRLTARAAANLRWAKEPDRAAATAKARAAFWQRFLEEVDPNRILSEAERTERALQARRAYFQAMAARRVANGQVRGKSRSRMSD